MENEPIAKSIRINDQIRAMRVLLIDQHGQRVGEIATSDALRMAEEAGFDLVEVSPDATPPVCKIIDYGKMKYEETRAERKARANQKTIEVKEIRLSLKISSHDSDLKVSQAQKFLGKGHKVHLVIKMKGREQAFPDRAYALMQSLIEQIGSSVEQAPSRLGNQVTATLAASGAKPHES